MLLYFFRHKNSKFNSRGHRSKELLLCPLQQLQSGRFRFMRRRNTLQGMQHRKSLLYGWHLCRKMRLCESHQWGKDELQGRGRNRATRTLFHYSVRGMQAVYEWIRKRWYLRHETELRRCICVEFEWTTAPSV